MNFKNFDRDEYIDENKDFGFTHDDVDLDVVEAFAHDNGLIYSESKCSERFDDMIKECCNDYASWAYDDAVMVNEEFSNWKDSMCSDGELDEHQVNEYDYVGGFAK